MRPLGEPKVRPMSDIPGLDGVLGVERVEEGPDKVVVQFTIDQQHLQPFGIPHGGIYCCGARVDGQPRRDTCGWARDAWWSAPTTSATSCVGQGRRHHHRDGHADPPRTLPAAVARRVHRPGRAARRPGPGAAGQSRPAGMRMRQHARSGSPFEDRIGSAVPYGTGSSWRCPAPRRSGRTATSTPTWRSQARRCWLIALAALTELGGGTRHVIRTRQYIVDPADARARSAPCTGRCSAASARPAP